MRGQYYRRARHPRTGRARPAQLVASTQIDDGLLLAERSPGEGNRRTLALTSAGERFVTAGGELLEGAFARLLEAAQVSEADVLAEFARRGALLTLTEVVCGE